MLSRRADAPAEQGVSWVSDGQGEYRVAAVERQERGTTVQLKLKANAGEFLEPERLKTLIRKYSDHIAFPVRFDGRRAARRSGQQGEGAVGSAANGNQRRRVRRVLQGPSPRQRRSAALESQPRRRQARVHELAVRAGCRAVRSVESRVAEGRQALRAARLHHGSSDAVSAAVPALRPRRRRFERARAQRLARAVAARRSDWRDAYGADAPCPRHARAAGRGRREVREVLGRVRCASQGRTGRGLRQSRPARQAHTLQHHEDDRQRAGSQPQGLRERRQAGATGDLLSDRRVADGREEQPALGSVQRARHRGAAPDGSARRVGDAAPHGV